MPMQQASSSFSLLHEKVRRWVWKKGWKELREIQENAIQLIFNDECDLIIAAPTAEGKTEAAFLPIASRIIKINDIGAKTLYVSPLKALINDQHLRLETLFEECDIPTIKWHGDASVSKKKKFLNNPHGVVLITPESLEAILIKHGHEKNKHF